jgi:glutamate-5-semialdehyde dehydrogenase
MNTVLLDKRNAVLVKWLCFLKRKNSHTSKISNLANYSGGDLAMEKRLLVDDAKIDGMILSLKQLASQEDPIGQVRLNFTHDNGMKISNKTAAFGTILIIYESDLT